ncbi:MAG: cysteine desulfurase-like protein [Bacillota bacterium]|nr:cysteine desulfurase-like protein [Bacillota bacterium]
MSLEFKFDVDTVRKQFPACKLEVAGEPIAYMDGPGGTQVPQRVLDKIMKYMIEQNANEGGNFAASAFCDIVEDGAREAAADLLGCEPGEIGFNCSSTQNNTNIAHALARKFAKGSRIVTSEMEHRCNLAPWLQMGKDGYDTQIVKLDPDTQQLDLDDFKGKLTPDTKIVSLNWASNGLGTVTDVKALIKMAHEVGAITIVDAVHYAAHFPIDVKDIGTDILLCSAYKWFGPHIGVVYMRKDLIEELDFYNVMCDDIATGPRKFHMGTPQYELLAGVIEAVNFIASVGEEYAECFEEQLKGLEDRRRNVVAGMIAFDEYESVLAKQLRFELREIPGVTVYGPAEGQPRTPTVVFRIDGFRTEEVTKVLGDNGINSWHGDYYAVEIMNALGFGGEEGGGLVRLGLAPYCTQKDVDRTLDVIRNMVNER